MNHYQTILNYFDNRSTNASAESSMLKKKHLDLSLEVLGMLSFSF
jgi:hypothetical protein